MAKTGPLQPAHDDDRKLLHGAAARSLENRNRQQLYALAQTRGILGRSTMDKAELIEAIRRLQ
jgi:hypothetical protein